MRELWELPNIGKEAESQLNKVGRFVFIQIYLYTHFKSKKFISNFVILISK